jgi:hypothetical protein
MTDVEQLRLPQYFYEIQTYPSSNKTTTVILNICKRYSLYSQYLRVYSQHLTEYHSLVIAIFRVIIFRVTILGKHAASLVH